ncbi:rho GTPase-activating protein 33 isoform X2 [Xenopus tropicalis]|uniref:Rho GTPase-activating protein 33 n=1 Tax=Xenopus tropicalis TaxID=8364 RepID=A0A8J1JVD6_XENTR|nr:rho GTPase-activating protein 33 isoform X2 [Xenopus tropicalis]
MEEPRPCNPSGTKESPPDTEQKARGTDTLDSANESRLLSSAANPGVKGRPSKRITRGPFVKLADCAHYHYENVNYGPIQLGLSDSRTEDAGSTEGDVIYIVQVTCQGRSWSVLRSYEDFRVLDSNLHRCIFDRRFSQLLELPPRSELPAQGQLLAPLLSRYLKGLTGIVDSNINCGPILNWMEIDNHGNRLLVNEEASINVPAIAAAHVIKRYTAQAPDELSFEVGDIVSVIDMPPREDTSWWRGKHSFQVGFFPSECVQLITDSKSPSPTGVCRRHGKLAGLLRSFMASRPSKQRLRQRGILRERVFGTDLGEHLLNSGEEVPRVLLCCAQFIEKFGVVDGIYRLSGVSSNIQKLRHEFDSERIPDLSRDTFLQDVHCVSSLCKLYFRELPNPLLTYRLYQPFTEAMSAATEEDKLIRVHDLIQQLPPPHYRTLEYLMKHLSQLSTHSDRTGMHARNLAIIWAPNLLRSRDMESVGTPGADAFREVRVQSVLVEFLLCNVETLFSDTFTSIGRCGPIRPRSLLGVCPSGRLVSLQEAQARSQSQREAAEKLGAEKASPTKAERGLESSEERKAARGRKKSGGGSSWRTFFAIGKNSSHKKSRPGGIGNAAAHPRVSDTVTLRSAKSEESLCSHTSGTGLQRSSRLRRPRSTSDGLTTRLPHSRSVESLGPSSPSPPCVPSPPASARPQSAWIEEELDLSPPLPDTDGLGFDPLSFRLSFSDHEEAKSPIIVRAEITSPALAKALPRGVSLSPTAGCSPSPTHSPPERLLVDGPSQGPRDLSPPPQMLSLLLQSCQQHLSDKSVREVKGKLTGAPGQEEPPNSLSPQESAQPPSLSLLRQLPPPPPPKDPARLMALRLAESAQRALQASISIGTVPAKVSQRSAPMNPPTSAFRRSLSMECSESAVPRELYSDLRPPALSTNDKSVGQHRPLRLPAHNTLAPSSSPADVRKPTPTGIPPTRAPRLHTRSGSLPAPPSLCPPRIRPPPYRFPEEGPRLPHQCSAPPWPEPEGLYYEIVGDPPHMAPLNTSYGLIQPPWPHVGSSQAHSGFGNWYGASHGTDPEVVAYSRWDRGLHPQLRPYMVGGGVHYPYVRTPESVGKREEPIYVNLPLKGREQHDGTNDVAGLKPELPQKQRPPNPPSMAYHESIRGVAQRQVRHPHLLRREGSLGYFRPPSSHKAMWGTQHKFPQGRENPIFAYEAPTGAGQRMRYVHPHCLLSEEGTLYGNLEQRGVQHRSATPVGPPGFLRAPWTVHSEGQTRSYC